MENGNGHKRMNFYHKKSSRMGRSSSMEKTGKLTSSLASAEFIDGDYKLTDDILYENKLKNKFDDDSHDTILLNKYSSNYNVENYIHNSQNLLDVLERSKNYFKERGDINNQIIENKKYIYENQKKLINEIKNLSDEYNREKLKNKELEEKINQKKLREKVFPNFTDGGGISPEELKKKKEYISYLENYNGKLEKENKDLIILLNSRKNETESKNNNYNYEEEEYCKFFIKNEINRLKELLSDFNNQTKNQLYSYNDLENNFTKESKQNNQSDRNYSYYDENDLTNTGGEYHYKEHGNNSNNNNKYNVSKINLSKRNELPIPNNNNINNYKENMEINPCINSNEFNANSNSHPGINNKIKTKSKLNNEYIGNKSINYKYKRDNSKKKK